MYTILLRNVYFEPKIVYILDTLGLPKVYIFTTFFELFHFRVHFLPTQGIHCDDSKCWRNNAYYFRTQFNTPMYTIHVPNVYILGPQCVGEIFQIRIFVPDPL
jgi:hypothetical protein